MRSIFGNLEGAHLKRVKSLTGLSSYPVRDHGQLFSPIVDTASSGDADAEGLTGADGWARLASTPGLCGEARETQNPSATAAVVSINDAMMSGRTPMRRVRASATLSFRSDACGAGL